MSMIQFDFCENNLSKLLFSYTPLKRFVRPFKWGLAWSLMPKQQELKLEEDCSFRPQLYFQTWFPNNINRHVLRKLFKILLRWNTLYKNEITHYPHSSPNKSHPLEDRGSIADLWSHHLVLVQQHYHHLQRGQVNHYKTVSLQEFYHTRRKL